MRRQAWIVTALLALGTAAQAEIAVTPSQPTLEDEVRVKVSHWTNTGGYHIDAAEARILGGLIYIDLFWTVPGPGTPVTQAFVLHERTVALGELDAGRYTVRVTHHGLNVPAESVSFTVSRDQTPEPEPACDCKCHLWTRFFTGRPCPFCPCDGQDPIDDGTPSLLRRLQDLMSRLQR